MTWKIVHVLAVVFCGVTFLSCMLVAPHTPMGGEITRVGTSIVEEWSPKKQRFCFLSLNHITVAVLYILWNFIFYFIAVVVFFVAWMYSMMISGDSFRFPASDISLLDRVFTVTLLTVFKCIVQMVYNE